MAENNTGYTDEQKVEIDKLMLELRKDFSRKKQEEFELKAAKRWSSRIIKSGYKSIGGNFGQNLFLALIFSGLVQICWALGIARYVLIHGSRFPLEGSDGLAFGIFAVSFVLFLLPSMLRLLSFSFKLIAPFAFEVLGREGGFSSKDMRSGNWMRTAIILFVAFWAWLLFSTIGRFPCEEHFILKVRWVLYGMLAIFCVFGFFTWVYRRFLPKIIVMLQAGILVLLSGFVIDPINVSTLLAKTGYGGMVWTRVYDGQGMIGKGHLILRTRTHLVLQGENHISEFPISSFERAVWYPAQPNFGIVDNFCRSPQFTPTP